MAYPLVVPDRPKLMVFLKIGDVKKIQMVSESNKYLLAGATDSGLAEILAHTLSDSAQLTPVEWVRSFYYERVFWRNMENGYFQHKRGILDDSGWEVYKSVACSGINKKNWKYHTPALSKEFVTFIETNTK